MNLKFIKSGEKKRILAELEEKFGITELPGIMLETGKEKIRVFSGTMTRDEILELRGIANVEAIGLYLIKREKALRLSLDAPHMLDVKKSFFEINDEQFKDWIRGKDLDLKIKPGIYVVKHNEDLLGCGVSNGTVVFNFMPKERRIRN